VSPARIAELRLWVREMERLQHVPVHQYLIEALNALESERGARRDTYSNMQLQIEALQAELEKLRNPGHTCVVLGPCDGGCR
jgi:hypothetical protein